MNTHIKIDAKDNEILNLVASSFVTAKEIADRLFMSESTVRRRLAGLEEAGWVIRTHGGAVLNKNQQPGKNLPLYLRTMQLGEEKHLLASKAVSLINDGDTLFVDGSSTVLFLLPLLHRFPNVTVFTNSIKAATMLAEMEIACTFFGGDVISGELACRSEETFDLIAKTYADWFFFSCDGLSDDGVLTDHSKHNCYLRLQYMKQAKRSVLLIDDTKLGKQCSHRLCHLSEVDVAVCNRAFPDALIERAPETVLK